MSVQRAIPHVQGGVQDTQIVTDPADPTKASTNYGSVSQLRTGYSGTEYRQILLRFDLGAIPSGSTVDSAALTFRMVQSLGKAPLDLHVVTAPWTENTVTWSSFAGAFDPAILMSVPTLGVPNNSNLTVDVKSIVAQWAAGTLPNHGLLFDHPNPGRTIVGASEAPNAGPRPKLDVCYFPPACDDGIQNGGEAGIDCGGPCDVCPYCGDGVCQAVAGEACDTCTADCGDCYQPCHDVCDQGGRLDPACADPCVAQICAADPYCCTVFWDPTCVGEANSCGSGCPTCGNGYCASDENCAICPQDCGGCNCAHDLCTEGVPLVPGTCLDPCVSQICDYDYHCCTSSWDLSCVAWVSLVCGSSACIVCGDLFCDWDLGESSSNCPTDCGFCGDLTCDFGEDCSNCPTDCCGYCGNGSCEYYMGESCSTCSGDCTCGTCGDGECAFYLGEDCASCPDDCPCSACGNGTCDFALGEDCFDCPADCPYWCSSCGDSYCDTAAGEDCASCPGDCAPLCGP